MRLPFHGSPSESGAAVDAEEGKRDSLVVRRRGGAAARGSSDGFGDDARGHTHDMAHGARGRGSRYSSRSSLTKSFGVSTQPLSVSTAVTFDPQRVRTVRAVRHRG